MRCAKSCEDQQSCIEMSLVKQRREVKPPKKSGKGCWTCKARKIGCDQQLPICNNCTRTGRSCGGYGIKVQWPESADGRRPQCEWESKARKSWNFVSVENSGSFHFLNTTYDDLQSPMSSTLSRRRSFRISECPSTIAKGLNVGFDTACMMPEDKTLLAYYHEVISRMITTIDDSRNGFRTVLIPNALSGKSLSSQSLRESILALSAFHLWGRDAAVKYKIRAMRLLSQSIDLREKELPSQFATCMMLCVCDVFDAADGSWYNHLRAAGTICMQAKAMPTGGYTTYFLTTWLSYHQVLAEFSHTPEQWMNEQIVPELPSHDAQKQVIIGSLGCSMQVLECISCINKLTHLITQSPFQTLPIEFAPIPDFLQTQLETLQQIPGIVEDSTSGRLDETKILNTAELYRLAALIYLHRSVIGTLSGSPAMKFLVIRSLDLLDELWACTSPWPIFMTACEVIGDEQRIRILEAVHRMQKQRRIGNVAIMRKIIEAVWKQADLYPCQEGKTRVDWKQLVDLDKQIPSFI